MHDGCVADAVTLGQIDTAFERMSMHVVMQRFACMPAEGHALPFRDRVLELDAFVRA